MDNETYSNLFHAIWQKNIFVFKHHGCVCGFKILLCSHIDGNIVWLYNVISKQK